MIARTSLTRANNSLLKSSDQLGLLNPLLNESGGGRAIGTPPAIRDAHVHILKMAGNLSEGCLSWRLGRSRPTLHKYSILTSW